jgi:hypothetical protein
LRGQQEFSSSFLKAMWSINIPNLLTSALTIAEFAVALMVMNLIRLAIGVVPVVRTGLMFMRLATDAPLRGCPSAHDGQKPCYKPGNKSYVADIVQAEPENWGLTGSAMQFSR